MLARIVRGMYRRFGIELVTTYCYVANASGVPTPEPPALPPGMRHQDLQASDAESFAKTAFLSPDEVRTRLQRGDRCSCVYRDAELVHFSWAQFVGSHRILPAARTVEMRQGQVCMYHCFTAASARGHGLYPSTLALLLRDSFSVGATLGWIYTTKDNVASQRGIEKAGFRYIAKVRALRIGSCWIPLTPLSKSFFEVMLT